jgi:MFS family permease
MTSTDTLPEPQPSALALIRTAPALRHLLTSRALSVLSLQMITTAVGWQIYEVTGSAWQLGLVAFAQFIPLLLLTPIIGYVVDRYDRRRVAFLCQVLAALVAAVMAIGIYRGWLPPVALIILMSVIGIGRAFEFPALAALLASTVGRQDLARATAIYSGFNQTAVILGPVIAGALIVIAPWLVYACVVAALSYAAFVVLHIASQPQAREMRKISIEAIAGGAIFLKSNRLLLGTISLDLVAVLFGSIMALMPIFAKDVLNVGAQGLGLLRAAPAVGAVVALAWFAQRPVQRQAGNMMLLGVAIFALATFVFGLSRVFWLSLLALVVMGAADVLSVIVRQSLVQLRTPDDMRGRVGSLNTFAIQSANLMGDFRAGAVAAAIGAVPTVMIGAVATLGLVGLWAVIFPEIRRLERLEG